MNPALPGHGVQLRISFSGIPKAVADLILTAGRIEKLTGLPLGGEADMRRNETHGKTTPAHPTGIGSAAMDHLALMKAALIGLQNAGNGGSSSLLLFFNFRWKNALAKINRLVI